MLKSTKNYINKQVGEMHEHFHQIVNEQHRHFHEELDKLKDEPQMIKLPINTDDFPRIAQFPSWFEIKKGLDKMHSETKNRFEEFAKEHDDCNCIDCQLKELSKIENKSMYELTTYCNLLTRKMMLLQSEKGGIEVEIKDLKRINSAQENKTKLKQLRIEQLEKIQEMDNNKIEELNDSISFRDATIDSLSDQLESKELQIKTLNNSVDIAHNRVTQIANLQEIIDNGKAENKRLIERIQEIEKSNKLISDYNGKLRLECAEKQDMLDEIRKAIIKVTAEPKEDTESEGSNGY